MSSFGNYFRKNKEALNTKTAKVGGYSFLVTVIFIAVLIAFNLAVEALPATWTHYDISAARLYSVTSSTKATVRNLDRDVTIYLISQTDEEDIVTERLLDVYDALSDRLRVVKKNPDVYPAFASQYTDEKVENNSLVVECGDRYRFIPVSDIYEADMATYYTTGSVAYDFNGESVITSAIDYVVTEDLPKLYVLNGHGELDLPDSFASRIERQNIETVPFSLLNVDAIPADADGVMIYSPENDISEKEASMLSDWVSAGGHLLVFSGPTDEKLENLDSLMTGYGVTAEEGIVIEADRNSYAFSSPYILLPKLGESEITSELSENNSYVLAPLARGLTIGTAPAGVTVTSLLDTSDESFSKVAGFAMESYDKEDGDIEGPFSVAVQVEDSNNGGMVIWVSTGLMMDDTYSSYSAGANADFGANALSELVGKSDSVSIASKSLDYNYLTLTDSQSSLIKWCLIAIVPLAFLVAGIEDIIERRKLA